jgi:hypothetical protein
LSPDRAAFSGRRAADHCIDAIGILPERLQPPAVPDVNLWGPGFKNVLERRLEQHLRHPHGGFERHRAVVALADLCTPLRKGGIAEARQFPPVELGHP